MKYWEEMQSKWGFGDGDATPPDAYECRAVYVEAVNVLAERLGSAYRYEAYDRGGLHNDCMIATRRADQTLDQAFAEHGGEGDDEAMRDAVRVADELGLDQFVQVRVVTAMEGLAQLLDDLDDDALGNML